MDPVKVTVAAMGPQEGKCVLGENLENGRMRPCNVGINIVTLLA